MSCKVLSLILLPASLILASSANAGIVISVTEVGNDVVLSWSGTLVNTATAFDTASPDFFYQLESNEINGQQPNSILLNEGQTTDRYTGGFATTPNYFFPAYRGFTANSITGPRFSLWQNSGSIYLETGVDWTQTQSGTATFNSRTLDSMTFIEGTYVWTHNDFVGETITMNVGSNVPEPSSVVLFSLVGCVAGISHRRRRAAGRSQRYSIKDSKRG